MAARNISGRIQIRRDTATTWATKNPTLLAGELGYESDTKRIKIGDGSTTWNNLSYVAGTKYVSACTAGNYKAVNTVISLSVSLANYSELAFMCGDDSASVGLSTIIVPLHTGKTYHRISWNRDDTLLNYQWTAGDVVANTLIVTINESTNKVTITKTNTATYGIRQIFAK